MSLIEMMLALAVLLILLAAGGPDFRRLIEAQRLTTTVNEFFAAVMLTRSEAIGRGTRVDLVPAVGADWSTGWIVLVDANGNQQADPGEEIILVHGPAPRGMSIKSGFTGSRQYLIYNAVGRSRSYGGGPRSGHWLFTLGQQQRKLIVNFLGRPRTCNPDTGKANC